MYFQKYDFSLINVSYVYSYDETENHLINIPLLHNDLWTLYIDGSKYEEGVGTCSILINPQGQIFFLSCRLEFECTNNVAEYEAFLQGLKKEIDMEVKELTVSEFQKLKLGK